MLGCALKSPGQTVLHENPSILKGILKEVLLRLKKGVLMMEYGQWWGRRATSILRERARRGRESREWRDYSLLWPVFSW
jgi:hypothetical protein